MFLGGLPSTAIAGILAISEVIIRAAEHTWNELISGGSFGFHSDLSFGGKL